MYPQKRARPDPGRAQAFSCADQLRGVVLPVAKTKNAYIRNDGINEYTNPAKYLTVEEYRSKMLAATELDNMLKASKYLRWKKDNGHHKEATRGWTYYQTIFSVKMKDEIRVYSGEIQIMRIARGDVFHDITKIKDVTNSNIGQSIIAHAQSAGNVNRSTASNMNLPQGQAGSQEGKLSVAVPQSSAEYAQMQRQQAQMQRTLQAESVKNTFALRQQFTEGTERNVSATELPDTAHVRFRTLPAVTVASVTYRGSYAMISDVYADILAWIADGGYECDGPMFNIYHVSPHETQNPDEFVTEVCYPVRRR